jgi:hypothetical protein
MLYKGKAIEIVGEKEVFGQRIQLNDTSMFRSQLLCFQIRGVQILIFDHSSQLIEFFKPIGGPF